MLSSISKDSVHDARFGLMLTDNVIELTMHELAKHKHSELKASWIVRERYQHTKELKEAMGRVFEAKVKFAKLEGLLTEEQARTVAIMHDFRNELYHVGLQHEAILPALSRFYFSTACAVLGAYPILYFGYLIGIQLPERSKKYFTSRGDYSPAESGDFAKACKTMEVKCDHKKADTIRALADNMEQIISEQDTNLDIVAEGVYVSQQKTRDQAIVACQIWPLAFSVEGKNYAKERGFSGENLHELQEWLEANYPLRFRKDPIPGWQRQVARLRSKGDPHVALANYAAFMEHTGQLREVLNESAMAAEAEIQLQIDIRRGK